ncbi:MAG: hypothetical protein ACK5Y8_10640 [Betaproteobacteria bacterium]|jgi:hypothetical protein|nr:hypothetical protein [Rubrivivax sp.]
MNPSLADALAFALEVGAIDLEHARSEALRELEGETEPTDATIELLEVCSRAEAISVLHRFATASQRGEASRLILGALRESLLSSRLSQRQVTSAIDRMAREGYLPTPEAEGAMYFFEEDLSLVEAGELGPEFRVKILEDLHAFLSQHAA